METFSSILPKVQKYDWQKWPNQSRNWIIYGRKLSSLLYSPTIPQLKKNLRYSSFHIGFKQPHHHWAKYRLFAYSASIILYLTYYDDFHAIWKNSVGRISISIHFLISKYYLKHKDGYNSTSTMTMPITI